MRRLGCPPGADCLHDIGDDPRPSGQAPPGLSFCPSARRGSRVKRDFACTLTRHLPPVLIVLLSQLRLRLEGRARTLSGSSPDLSPARTLDLTATIFSSLY